MFKRIISILLLMAILGPWLPSIETKAATDVDAIAYVDALKGSDDNDGLTEATAKKTLNGGYSVLKATLTEQGKVTDPNATGKLVLVSDYNWVFESDHQRDIAKAADYAHKYHVIYAGKTPDVSLSFSIQKQSYIGMIGPTTIEHMNIRIAPDSTNTYLSLHSRGKLIIGEGVTNASEEKYQLSITALPYYSKTTLTGYLEINSGTWRNAYAGPYSVTNTGDCSLVFNGGTVNKIGAVFNGTLGGNANITVNGGTVGQICNGALNTSGTVSGSVTTTLVGGTLCGAVSTANAGNSYTILAPKSLTLDCGGTLVANTLTGGNLNIQPGTQLQITDSVTGITNITPVGGVYYGTYLTAPASTADSSINFVSGGLTVTSDGTNKVWSCTDESKIGGLKLMAASDVTVKLYPGFSGGSAITPDKTTTENGLKCYYFANVKGSYRYTASGTGYYTITKNIYVSDKEALVLTELDVTPSKRAGTGWEAASVKLFTDEYIANFPSDPALWPDYQEAFQTPQFTTTSAQHQHTTQKEMEDFITQLDVTNSNMYVYSMGLSAYGLNMPLVVFTKTDLSGAKTLEEVAELLNSNGKMTIHYQGQMHGNEPAGGEGVLAMMLKLSGDYGDDVLDTVNIYCIPRLNPDGAQKDKRVSPKTELDMNRDFLLAINIETVHLHNITNLFKPTVMIDSHEYTAEPDRTSEKWWDLLISPGFNPTSGEDFKNLGITMTQNAFTTAAAQGLSYDYYTSQVNSKSAYVGRNYAALEGTLFFLIESRGINFGTELYERRVVGHLITATSFIDYIVEHADTVRSIVNAEKQRIIECGKTYEEEEVLVLESSTTKHPELNIPSTTYNTATGVGTSSTVAVTVVDQIDRSRSAPTAYVIPAGESWTQKVLDLMDIHTIEYTFAPAGSAITLQGYTGTTEEASLTDETLVSFPNGAYIFTMAQEEGKILAMLMEPDVTDISAGTSTLAMAGIIPKTGDTFPIYRYIHDLNDDGTLNMTTPPDAPTGLTAVNATTASGFGTISGLDATKTYEYRAEGGSYITVPAGATAIENLTVGTYYVRFPAEGSTPASATTKLVIGYALSEYVVYLSTTGSDSNDGYTATKPVASVEVAYAQLDAIMAAAPEGANGKLVISGLFNLGTAVFTFPTHSYPVVITGKTTADGFTYKGGTDTGGKNTIINFKGDTTLEHMTLKLTSTIVYNYIGANGCKLVLGEGLNCVANSKGAYFNLCGGSFSGTFASTDLTVKSGSWRNIYYGSYTGSVTGDAKLTMTGGTVTNYIQAGYNSSVGGDCYVNISGISVGGRIVAGGTNSGTYSGDATIVLGTNITGTPTVAPATKGTVSGTFTLIVDGANTTAMTLQATNITSGTAPTSVLVLKSGTVGAATGFGSVVLDGYVSLGAAATYSPEVKNSSSFDLAGYTLTGDFTGSGTLHLIDSSSDSYALPTGKVIGSVSCNLPQHFKADVSGTAKRYMVITDSEGYTSNRFYLAITKVTVRPGSTGFGYKASFYGNEAVLAQVDGIGFRLQLEGKDRVLTQTAAAVSGKEYSMLLQNFDIANYGETAVNAEVFLKLKSGDEIVTGPVSYSMKTMLQQVCKLSLTNTQLTALRTMCAPYKTIMEDWDIDKILN